MLLQKTLHRRCVEVLILRHHLDETRQVRKQVALVPVRKDCRDGGRVELDFIVVHLDKVYGWMCGDEVRYSRLRRC